MFFFSCFVLHDGELNRYLTIRYTYLRYLESPSTVSARERMKLMSCFIGEIFDCFFLDELS